MESIRCGTSRPAAPGLMVFKQISCFVKLKQADQDPHCFSCADPEGGGAGVRTLP